ncbi:MAG: ParA family protein [Halobacteriales archaeon]|nr:ParA family protein [Halobacteriales archaeon]
MSGAAAFVGTAGGAGVTRLCVESAALLSTEGAGVVVLDASFATQGLATHLSGRLPTDVTTLVTEERPLGDAAYELPTEGDGTVVCVPARAPFERLARAKTPDAAQAFERLLDEARDRVEHVIVDVPPVASNEAVAGVTAADTVTLVTPGDRTETVSQMRDRLTDIGTSADTVVATRTEESTVADVTVPRDATPAGETPVADSESGPFTAGVAAVVEHSFGITVSQPTNEGLIW